MTASSSPRAAPDNRLGRALSAIPDALTASWFLVLWCFPLAFGTGAVRNGMLLALVEFVTLHASVMLGHFALSPKLSRSHRALYLLCFGLFYSMFIGAFAMAFQAFWPVLAFGWLLAAKFAALFASPAENAARLQTMQTTWGVGAMIYIGGVLLTSMLPVPRLGISREVQALLDLPGSGLWVKQPQTLIAFGTIYFGLLSWSKWRQWRLPENTRKRR